MDTPNNRLGKLFSLLLDKAAVAVGPADLRDAQRIAANGAFGSLEFSAIWAGAGWPADVQRALERVPEGDWPPDLVIVAQRLSPGALDLLEARNANWADESGAARIVMPGAIIRRDGEAAEQARPRTFSWSPSAIAVAEALLAFDWSTGISTTELATLVQWSPPQVSQVLQAFDETGWTIKFGPRRGPSARRELGDTTKLLDAWAARAAAPEQDQRVTHRVIRSPLDFLTGELGHSLSEEVRWAVSGWAAARELAPITDAVPSLQIYVHEDDFGQALDRVLRATGLSDVAEGGRVAFTPAHPSVLALGKQGSFAPTVSAPRVYADLAALGGRGADAAAHVREVVLGHLSPAARDRQPPIGLVEWEQESRDRLKSLFEARFEDRVDPYASGSWSASYRLTGGHRPPDLRHLQAVLREVAGSETGWPAWWAPVTGVNRPRPVDGVLECWLAEMLTDEPAKADFWRADPSGRLCLIRAHEEDSEYPGVEPGTVLDLVYPIWRVGECLLHAERLARRLDADEVQMMLRWTGIRGRRLTSLSPPRRRLASEHVAVSDQVVSYLHTTPDHIHDNLAAQVRALVDPLYESFDLFEPPSDIYERELGEMRAHARDHG